MDDVLLPGFLPSEQDLIDKALATPLDKKIVRAIALIREYEKKALELSSDGYYLAFSGGKDSIVIKQLAIEAGVRFMPWYNTTTIDPPELIYYMRQHHPDVKWNSAQKSFFKALEDTPPPTIWTRWCCSRYKEQGGRGLFKVVGVRIVESSRRAKLWQEFAQKMGSFYLAPICYWTDADVWNFIHSRNLPYCKLYDEGFKRLGCVGCPLAGDDNKRKQFERWPRYEMFWKPGVRKYFDLRRGTMSKKTGKALFVNRFQSFEEYWQWWMDGADKGTKQLCAYEEQFLGIAGTSEGEE